MLIRLGHPTMATKDVAALGAFVDPLTRYWVGGTGTWNTTNTTNWAYTSGGAGGAPVPTALDGVFFDGNSGTGTVTVDVTASTEDLAVCKSITFTGYTGTFTIAASRIVTVYGSCTLASTTTFNYGNASSTISFKGTGTLNAGGTTNLPSLIINNGTGTLTLGSNITTASGRSINVLAGNFVSAGYTITLGSASGANFISSNSNVRSINVNNSTIDCATISFVDGTNLTFSGSGASWTVGRGGIGTTQSLNTVTLGSLTLRSGAGGITVNGSPTVNNFTIVATTGGRTVSHENNSTFTITGTLSASGTSGNLITIGRVSSGVVNYVKASGTPNFDYCSISNMTCSGGATWTATNSTDGGGNTGLSFI